MELSIHKVCTRRSSEHSIKPPPHNLGRVIETDSVTVYDPGHGSFLLSYGDKSDVVTFATRQQLETNFENDTLGPLPTLKITR